MSGIAEFKVHAPTRPAAEVIRLAQVAQAANGICYTAQGETGLPPQDLERMVLGVPRAIAAALDKKAFYFVPLAIGDGEDIIIAERYDVALSDKAVCHRNLGSGEAQCIFISTRLMEDKFSVAFEFYINVGHAFVDRAGVSQSFADLVWRQVEAKVRGETSLDAHEFRKIATSTSPGAEKAKNDYFAATFSDAIAIYMLAVLLDVDYYELREREYALLAPNPLAERLRKIHELFPPNHGFDFNIFYRRRQ